MKAIIFSLKTLQPILATSFQGDPNSDVSYPYIPGSMIRGMLIGRYLKRPEAQSQDILTNEAAKRLFFDGTTRYLNAYLSSQEGKRTLPVLLSWRKQKGEELKNEYDRIKVYDFSVNRLTDNELNSPKSISEPFWITTGSTITLYSINRRINIHNRRDRRKGRSTEAEGEIFRYDAIDAGQTFQGVILCDEADKQLIQLIQDLLQPADAWLGGSRSAGYGHIHIEISDVKNDDSWSEIESKPEERAKSNILKITLLSDLTLRDEWGHYAAIPPTQLLSEKLGVKLEKPKVAYTDSVLIGGFNRKWGLPLPQVPAVKAGSVFVYVLDENVSVTAEQIRKLEIEGLGERRVEGFGRIAVNWCLEKSQFTAKKPKPPRRREQRELETQESRHLAYQIAKRILRQKLERLLLEKIEPHQLKPNQMTNSQLSRLMIVTRQALDKNSRQPLDNLLNQLPSNARGQYERTKVGGQSLDKKIKGWLDQPRAWIEDDIKPVAIADEPATLTDELAMEYTLRLIMAIAKNAIKEKANEQ